VTDRSTSAPAKISSNRWIAIGISAAFALVYGYYLWDAIWSLMLVPQQYEAIGLGRENAPWPALIAGVVVPVLAYAAALRVSARRPHLLRALILLVGLAALACLSLTIIALG
jgi:hypothetical protein